VLNVERLIQATQTEEKKQFGKFVYHHEDHMLGDIKHAAHWYADWIILA
jgi:hypothetical protein